jgi:hypothetical protein
MSRPFSTDVRDVWYGPTAKCHNLSVTGVPILLGRYAWGKNIGGAVMSKKAAAGGEATDDGRSSTGRRFDAIGGARA